MTKATYLNTDFSDTGYPVSNPHDRIINLKLLPQLPPVKQYKSDYVLHVLLDEIEKLRKII